jgi:hypothetical protein
MALVALALVARGRKQRAVIEKLTHDLRLAAAKRPEAEVESVSGR